MAIRKKIGTGKIIFKKPESKDKKIGTGVFVLKPVRKPYKRVRTQFYG